MRGPHTILLREILTPTSTYTALWAVASLQILPINDRLQQNSMRLSCIEIRAKLSSASFYIFGSVQSTKIR